MKTKTTRIPVSGVCHCNFLSFSTYSFTDINNVHSQDSEISSESDLEGEGETVYDRLYALKDIVPPSARRNISSSASALTSFAKSSVSFTGKALWVISTSVFLVGVPWALAYAEEEQYIQLEREQGMIKGANEVRFFFFFFGLATLPTGIHPVLTPF